MSKLWRTSLLALVALPVIALLLQAEEKKKAPAPELVVLATTQSLGNLEPCNCVEDMLGGFPRRLALIKRARKAKQPLLVVDGGDLTGKAYHPRLLTLKTEAALALLKESGAQAVAVGERDLRLGVKTLTRLGNKAKIALLGANIWTRSAKPTRPFSISRTVKVGKRTVFLTGVLAPALGDPTGELRLADPAETLRKVLANAPKGPGVYRVVLFHGTAAQAKGLAKVSGIDLIVAGHDQRKGIVLGKLGQAALALTQRDARAVTRIEVGKTTRLRHVPLDEHIPDDKWSRARIDRYYREARGLPEPPRKKVVSGGQFVGAQGCADCHVAQAALFAKTKHHKAQARVLKKDPKRGSLRECIGCHVTGLGYASGFVDMKHTPHLAEVGCEACHGVGGNHAAQGGGRGYGVKAGFPNSWKPVCLKCHDASNSPNFDFKKAMARIKHWKDRGRGKR